MLLMISNSYPFIQFVDKFMYHNTWEHVFENEKYARVETPKICKYRLSLNEKCKNLKILGSEIEIMIFQSFP